MILTSLALAAALQAGQLDFDVYRTRVEPIMLKKRPGMVACYKCHSVNNVRLFQRLAPGQTAFTEAESRKNFEAVSAFVRRGEPLKSPLLIHPLAEKAGGDRFHSGGKQWNSQKDPEWRTLADWVSGKSH